MTICNIYARRTRMPSGPKAPICVYVCVCAYVSSFLIPGPIRISLFFAQSKNIPTRISKNATAFHLTSLSPLSPTTFSQPSEKSIPRVLVLTSTPIPSTIGPRPHRLKKSTLQIPLDPAQTHAFGSWKNYHPAPSCVHNANT